MKVLRSFFADDVGECSCMRLMVFVVVCVILGVWAWGCVKAGAYIPMGYSDAATIGAALASKAAQTKFEGDVPGPGSVGGL